MLQFFIHKRLTGKEAQSFRMHLGYSIFDGMVLGILALNEFVFIKSMKGGNYELGLLFQFSAVVFCLLILFNEILSRIRNKKKLLRVTALITRLPLFLLLFFPSTTEAIGEPFWHYLFLAVFFIYYLAQLVITPVINMLLKQQYTHENFGTLYGISQSVNKIMMLVFTFAYGWILDVYPYSFIWILPITGLMGILSIILLAEIEYNPYSDPIPSISLWKSVKSSTLNMVSILKSNRPYLHFEIGFMLYGFAYMISVTIITIYFDKALNLNYSSVAFYKNIYNLIAIALLPYFGRLLGRRDPRSFAVITYLSIALFLIFLALTQYFPAHFMMGNIRVYYLLIPYVIFYGIYAATMVLLWNIGSVYFCERSQAGDYQAVHMSLTGIRALFAPTSGVIIYVLFGFQATFASAVVALIIAIGLMFWSRQRINSFKD